MEVKRIDCSKQTPEELALAAHHAKLVHRFNMAEPYTEEWTNLMHEIFKGRIGEGSRVMSPLTAVRPHEVTIGKDCIIMNGCLMMSAGGITIEDGAMIAANCQLISNNHDPYERCVITCKPVQIKKGAWIGAGSTILPGVTVGKYAIVGASSTVTKDIPDYAVAVGSPAKVIKYLDKEKFND
ncbi:MAG: galactoside O-acetyltransferase [bacterium]|nr:galactoside O-acetyltransferase [Candidatus Minthenecus merdequi]